MALGHIYTEGSYSGKYSGARNYEVRSLLSQASSTVHRKDATAMASYQSYKMEKLITKR